MENEEIEVIDSTTDETETIDSSNDTEEVEVEVETKEEKEEYTEREKQLYARLKKAEAELKERNKPKPEAQSPKVETKLSTFDMLALQKANIETEEDLDEVVRWADYNKISVAEALKSNILKATLKEKAEIRLSALAVNTGTGRRAGGAVSDARLLADAQKGILPESPEDIAKLARMRLGKK